MYLYSASLEKSPNVLGALLLYEQKCLAGAWQQLRWRSCCSQGPGDCSRRTDQQWQKSGGRTCLAGDASRTTDFARWNADVSGWTVGHSERRGADVPDRSGTGKPWTSHGLYTSSQCSFLWSNYVRPRWNYPVSVVCCDFRDVDRDRVALFFLCIAPVKWRSHYPIL